MIEIILVIHLLIALAMVVVVLLQRSEGGGLGIGGGGGAGGGLMSGRGSANLLTRTTAVLAAAFFCTSLGLAILTSGSSEPTSILDGAPLGGAAGGGALPTAPAEPAAPLAR